MLCSAVLSALGAQLQGEAVEIELEQAPLPVSTLVYLEGCLVQYYFFRCSVFFSSSPGPESASVPIRRKVLRSLAHRLLILAPQASRSADDVVG